MESDIQEFFYKGHSIKIRRFGGTTGWTAYRDGHAVAAGAYLFGTSQENLALGKRAVRQIISGKRKPFAKPEPIAEADRLVAKRMLSALNAGMRDILK